MGVCVCVCMQPFVCRAEEGRNRRRSRKEGVIETGRRGIDSLMTKTTVFINTVINSLLSIQCLLQLVLCHLKATLHPAGACNTQIFVFVFLSCISSLRLYIVLSADLCCPLSTSSHVFHLLLQHTSPLTGTLSHWPITTRLQHKFQLQSFTNNYNLQKHAIVPVRMAPVIAIKKFSGPTGQLQPINDVILPRINHSYEFS